MEYTLDMGAWNAVFAVPCALVDKHIKLAGKEQLQVVLWALRHAGESFSPEGLARALGMSADSALDALEYWRDRGLLAQREGTFLPMPQREEVSEPPAPEPLREEMKPEKRPLPPKQRMARPDNAYLAARMKDSEEVRSLFGEAEAILGVLSPAMTATLLACHDDYGLPPEVVVMLIQYAKDAGKANASYIGSVARDWAESGVLTLEAAEQKLRELDETQLAWAKVSAAAGLSRRGPSPAEKRFSHCWVYEWGFSREMLEAAYERCANNTGKFSARYMNTILEDWHARGIADLKALNRETERKQEERKPGRTYDMDEVERLSFFDLPEEL